MKLKFSVEAQQSNPSAFCSLKIKQDEELIKYIEECKSGLYEFEFSANKLTTVDFLISNKNPKDTIVSNGKVIKDTKLRILGIKVNNKDVTDKINLFSNYYTNDNGIMRTNGHMTYNGRYRFKFRYPASNHILYCTYYKPKN